MYAGQLTGQRGVMSDAPDGGGREEDWNPDKGQMRSTHKDQQVMGNRKY
ncbi:MAG: hypothetical protein ACTSQO_12155 [Candidatus Helarchaeota archaeon]